MLDKFGFTFTAFHFLLGYMKQSSMHKSVKSLHKESYKLEQKGGQKK